MPTLCDLHTHTHFSDGTYSPAELIAEAERVGLSAVALCDHNTINGLPAFLEAAKNSSVEAIPAIEFSTDYRMENGQKMELHIVALFVRPEHYDSITALVAPIAENKIKSNHVLISALQANGYDITYDEVCAEGQGNINRAHMAAILTKKGYTASRSEAFQTVLSPERGFYVEPDRLPVWDVIKFIRSIGAVSVLAHPLLTFKENERALRTFLDKALPCGLLAMETRYSTYDQETTALAHSIAVEYGLCESGGSDFHAANKPDIALGSGKGNLAVPYEFLDKLRAVAFK